MGYVELALAIIGEVIGTNFMKASAGFTRLVPTTVTIIAYLACFYFFAQSLKTVNLSVAYATWGGNYPNLNYRRNGLARVDFLARALGDCANHCRCGTVQLLR